MHINQYETYRQAALHARLEQQATGRKHSVVKTFIRTLGDPVPCYTAVMRMEKVKNPKS